MNSALDLLTTIHRQGYPTDYLVARLRARSKTFAGRCPAGRGDEAWLELRREYSWLFRQMNVSLRKQLAPVFFYFELRNLFAALRFCAGADRDGLHTTLDHSLLGEQLQFVLKKDQPFTATLTGLDTLLSRYGFGFNRLDHIWQTGDLGHVEAIIFSRFMEFVQRQNPCLVIRHFLQQLLERHHLLLLSKRQHWQLDNSRSTAAQPFSVQQRLKRSLERLTRQDQAVQQDPARLDTLLLRIMLRDCSRQARSSEPLAMFLAYLYFCWMTARDCGIRGLVPLLNNVQIEMELVT